MCKRHILLFIIALAFFRSETALALTCQSNANGNWDVPGTWTGCGGAIPGAADTVQIRNANTVTIPTGYAAVANSVTFTASNGAANLTHQSNTSTLTVGAGGVTINGATDDNLKLWNINAGSATVNGSITLVAGSNDNRISAIVLTTGTLNVNGTAGNNGDITMTNAGTNVRTYIFSSGAANIFVTRSFLLSAGLGTLDLAAGSRFIYSSGSNASVAGGGAINYKHLDINKSGGTATLAANAPVAGDLTVTAGTLALGTFTASRTAAGGTISVANGATLNIGGTNTFPANYTVHALSTTSTVNYSGANQTITTETYGNLTLSGSGTKTMSAGALAIAGNFSMAGTAVTTAVAAITVSGTFTLGTTNNTFTAGNFTHNVTGALTNGGTIAVGTGTINAAATFTNNNVVTVSTGLLNVTGAYTNTVAGDTITITGAGGRLTVGGTLTNAGSIIFNTAAGGIVNANGDFVSSGTVTNTTAGTLNIKGNATVNGTFTAGAGSVVFNGGAAQNVSGSALGLFNVTMNNSNGIVLGNNLTVGGTLTFTSGAITTAANTLITTASCVTSVSRTSGHVIGNLRKAIPAGASTCTFEVGSGTNYTPVVAVFVAGTGAGNITASTTGTEHGSIAASGIDSTKSVNRFWTLTNGGVTLPGAGFTATFNYINGSAVDFDAAGTPANFIVERWDGTNWFPTTLNAACTSTPGPNLCEQVNGLTATTFGDFVIGEPLAGFNGSPGRFNVFETTTTAGSVLGRLFTKRLGAGTFAVAIVAVSNNAVNAAPATTALTVDVIDASSTGGTFTASSNCRTTWTTVIQSQTVPAAVAWASGRITVNITAPVQAVRNARIRVTQGANVGCSTDNFAIRPQAFTLTSTDATQTNTSGTPRIKTGASFNLTAASVAGYDGAPSLDNTKVVGTPTAGTIGGAFTAAPVATGTASDASFFYSEVGHFGLNQNAVFDSSFTSVDQPSDCTADFSNALVGGKYGCTFGSAAVAQSLGVSGFGRFIPDNFAVTFNAPQFATTCGTFSYIGQKFSYSIAPVMTVTARNGTNNGLTNAPTTNYAGAYMKITNTSLTPITQGARYVRFDVVGGGATPAADTTGLPAVGSDPTIGTFTAGVGTLTFSSGSGSGSGLALARNATPNAPFNADVALTLNVIDSDAVAFAGNPASVGAATAGNGIPFNNGNAMRFGRLRLFNASGSQLIAMPISIQAQYWNGTAFVTNTADSCTTLAAANVALGNYQRNLNAGETTVSVGGVFNAGVGTLRLSAPGTANNGSVDVSVNLTAGTAGTSCTGGMPATTGSSLSHLQGAWCGASYNRDPTARATFGVYRNSDQLIYQRENF